MSFHRERIAIIARESVKIMNEKERFFLISV